MFLSVDSSQMNMDNVEEFFIVPNNNVFELRVRFVSRIERVVYSGAREYCYQQLALIMTRYSTAPQAESR